MGRNPSKRWGYPYVYKSGERYFARGECGTFASPYEAYKNWYEHHEGRGEVPIPPAEHCNTVEPQICYAPRISNGVHCERHAQELCNRLSAAKGQYETMRMRVENLRREISNIQREMQIENLATLSNS